MHIKTRIQNLFEEMFYTEFSGSKRLRAGILIGLLGFQGVSLLVIYILNNDEYLYSTGKPPRYWTAQPFTH